MMMRQSILCLTVLLVAGGLLVGGGALSADEGTQPVAEGATAEVAAPASPEEDPGQVTLADILIEGAFIEPFCNQGAYCTYKTDPVCGGEGFCNLPSHCCMCY